MTEVVETEGVVVEETIKPSDIPVDDASTYTIAGVVEYLKDPKNEAVIREFGRQLHEAPKRFAQKVEAEFAPVGQLMVNMAKDENVAQSVLDDFLRSITGIED